MVKIALECAEQRRNLCLVPLQSLETHNRRGSLIGERPAQDYSLQVHTHGPSECLLTTLRLGFILTHLVLLEQEQAFTRTSAWHLFFFVSPFFNVTLLKNLMLERGKQWRCQAHLLIRWGSSSDDMTITGIGFRGFSACHVWFCSVRE